LTGSLKKSQAVVYVAISDIKRGATLTGPLKKSQGSRSRRSEKI